MVVVDISLPCALMDDGIGRQLGRTSQNLQVITVAPARLGEMRRQHPEEGPAPGDERGRLHGAKSGLERDGPERSEFRIFQHVVDDDWPAFPDGSPACRSVPRADPMKKSQEVII